VGIEALPGDWVTTTAGAGRGALAVNGLPEALSYSTEVVLSARVIIIAYETANLFMCTATCRVATIYGADVAVIASEALPHALPFMALVIGGAQATVITWPYPR
jgi:hypothetical protein